MRATRFALALVVVYGSVTACTTVWEVSLPPPTPPPSANMREYRLSSMILELAESNGVYVSRDEDQVRSAWRAWGFCAIQIFFLNQGRTLIGYDPEKGSQNNPNGPIGLYFGLKFPAENADDQFHQLNWNIIRDAGHRVGAQSAKGSDNHITREIRRFTNGIWTNETVGATPEFSSTPLTPVGNYSVVTLRNVSGKRWILGHEMGHQLGLSLSNIHHADNGNLMCSPASCMGENLTGRVGAVDQNGINTQCGKARDNLTRWKLHEES